VSADAFADKFGADTARLFALFAVPPEKDMDWTDAGAEGMYRFLGRVFRFATRNAERARSGAPGSPDADQKALRKLHQTIRKISDDFESRWHFNTSISAIMELVNLLYAEENQLSAAALAEILEKLTLLLGPFAPYTAQEVWEELGKTGPVFKQSWPAYDAELAKEEGADIVVQVNGKVRSRLQMPFGTPDDVLKQNALADAKVRAFVEGKETIRIIVVPDKLVNIVVKG
jgi:leucyl-tRNA synthetase